MQVQNFGSVEPLQIPACKDNVVWEDIVFDDEGWYADTPWTLADKDIADVKEYRKKIVSFGKICYTGSDGTVYGYDYCHVFSGPETGVCRPHRIDGRQAGFIPVLYRSADQINLKNKR